MTIKKQLVVTPSVIQVDIRKKKLAARRALSEKTRNQAELKIAQSIIQSIFFKQAKHIAVYLSMPGEVGLQKVITSAWSSEKMVYLPVVESPHHPLKFCPYHRTDTLTQDCLKMIIPDKSRSHYIDANGLDALLMPLVAFDGDKNRIGMGGGYYDRTLANLTLLDLFVCGVAFDVQKTENIPSNDWDIKPHQIITESKII